MSELKERIDVLLVQNGIFESREKARASIMAGEIFADGIRIDKCGAKVKSSSKVEFKGEKLPYVSRGGLKLERAINSFKIDLNDKVCLDIGASTGGFTDCMLQNNAKKVFAVDVGYGQFAWKLRCNPKVTCMERTNIRYVKPSDIGEVCDFASIDVSFISLKKVVLVVSDLLSDIGEIVSLIKPQFEAGRENVGKKGVVRDPIVHIEVINNIADFLINNKFNIINLDYSPIKGPEGNIEYLIYYSKDLSKESYFTKDCIEEIVNASHNIL